MMLTACESETLESNSSPDSGNSFDSGTPFDSSTALDSDTSFDSSTALDSGASFDSATPDSSTLFDAAGAYVAPPCTANVMEHGAVGDGSADDRAAFEATFTAAGSPGVVCVPTGTYRVVGSLSVPNNMTLVGVDRESSWLQGHVEFGSNNTFVDLKIGTAGDTAIANRDGATDVRFERCRLRGGAGTDPVVAIGGSGDAFNLLFHDTLIERSLGTDANNVSIVDVWGGAHVAHVTFDNVTIGASNGIASGSSRMGLEAWCNSISNPDTPDHCWEDITVVDSIVEVSAFAGLDFSGAFAPEGPELSGPVRVERTVFMGASGYGDSSGWDLDLECPNQFTVRDNIFYRAAFQALSMNNNLTDNNTCIGKDLRGSVIGGNQFLLDVDNGVESWDWDQISLVGDGFEVSGNSVRVNQGPVESGQVFGFWWANGVNFTGNTIEDTRTDTATKMLRIGDTSSGNRVTLNTFITNNGVLPAYLDDGTANVFSDNSLVAH